MRLKTVLTGLYATALLIPSLATVAPARPLPVFADEPAITPALPVLKTTRDVIDVRVGKVTRVGAWSLAPEVKPDIFSVNVSPGKTETVTFISDSGEITFKIREGQSVDFNIVKGNTVCWTRITGLPPAANYDAAYRKANRGKVTATVPEVYELINIVIALTETAEKSDELVYKDSPYWKELQAWFGSHKDDTLVKTIDARMKSDLFAYFTLKMNGNSFEFNADEHIVHRKMYDRTGFPGGGENNLRPFVPELERFAKETRFREFYAAHKDLYERESNSFQKEIDLAGMRDWLQSRFPSKKPYDFVDVIFSPLVAWNQSSTWFESNGFRTLQPHVNYPYPEDVPKRNPPLATKTASFFRGMIVFTEINHGYLSPQSEQNGVKILAATNKTEGWLIERMRNNYSGTAVFDEYMNWGLVSVYALDVIPADAALIQESVAGLMKDRGFTRFAEFQPFLIKTYKERKPGQTISDLYPAIIGWFAEHNK